MSKKFSFAHKICAMILSLLIVIGSIPIAMAVDESNTAEPSKRTESPATPDEATDATLPAEEEAKDDGDFKLNSDAKSKVIDSIMYIQGESLKEISLLAHSSDAGYQAMSEDIDNENYDRFTVEYMHNSETDTLDNNACVFQAADDVLTVSFKVADAAPSMKTEGGKYTLSVKYTLTGDDETTTEIEVCEKGFVIVTAPVVSAFSYNGKEVSDWSKDDITVTFTATSEAMEEVVLDDSTKLEGVDGAYSFTAESGTHSVEAKDIFGNIKKVTTDALKVDKTEPAVSEPRFYNAKGQRLPDNAWTNDDVTVEVDLTDAESGIDVPGIQLNGQPIEADSVKAIENGITLSFKAKEISEYKIDFSDKVGHAQSKTIAAESIKIDREPVSAENITLRFTPAETDGDKLLSFLSFGMYNNDDIHVEVLVNDAGPAPVERVALYNDGEALSETDGRFTLSAGEADSKSYVLSVEVIDAAGNTTGKLNLTDSDVKTQVMDGTAESLKAMGVYEIVISKLAPAFDEDALAFDFAAVAEADGKTFVKSDEESANVISVPVSETSTGLAGVKAALNESVKTEVDLTAEKETQATVKLPTGKLDAGEYTFSFTAVANNGNSQAFSGTFTVDNEAPALVDGFTYSNDNNTVWTNENVTVQLALTDVAGVQSVTYKNGDVSGEAEKTETGYQFDASAYGEYTVTVTDILGNTKDYTTDALKIDKEKPVVDGEFDFTKDWTNEPVTVSFKAKDMPEGANSGVASAVLNGKDEIGVNDNVYSFSANEYGDYIVTVTDKAGNVSDAYTVGKVQFDNIKPAILGVTFNAANNVKDYGLFNNAEVVMAVSVENTAQTVGDEKIASPIKSIEILDGNKAVEGVTVTNKGDGKFEASYTIPISSANHSFSFKAVDEAGNEDTKEITSESFFVQVGDKKLLDNKEFNKLVVTLDRPAISEIQVSFDNGELKNSQNDVYSGQGAFTVAEIKDSLSFIDSCKTYFVSAEKVKFESGEIINLGDLSEYIVTQQDNLSDKTPEEKIENTVFKTAEKAKLESGEYYAIVEAVNLSGNKTVISKKVIVDNTAPTVTGFEITGFDGTYSKNGVYSQKELAVKVLTDDEPYTAGIGSVKLFDNDNEIPYDSEAGVFKLSNNHSYQLTALVTDVFGNTSKLTSIKDEDVSVTLNGTGVSQDKDFFEVVVNKDNKATKVADRVFDFDYSTKRQVNDEEAKYYKDVDKGTIKAEFENMLAGFQSTTIKLDGTEYKGGSDIVSVTETKDSSSNKVNKIAISLDVTKLPERLIDGAHTLSFVVTDLCKNETKISDVFYIDKTAPQVTSVVLKKSKQSDGEQFLNMVTFGLYSNKNIEAVITVKDSGPSAGIHSKDITLSTQTGKSVSEGETDEQADESLGITYIKTFTLNAAGSDEEDIKALYTDITVQAQDVFENGKDDTQQTPNAATVDEVNQNAPLGTQDFEIVVSGKAPEVGGFEVKGADGSKAIFIHNQQWFADNPTVDFSVSDALNKIHAIAVKINNYKIENHDLIYDWNGMKTAVPEVFTTFNDDNEDQDISHLHATINTDKQEIKDGDNTVEVVAVSNNGVSSTESITFYRDTTAPVITEFAFRGAGDSEGDGKNLNEAQFRTEYGYYFRNATNVTITANDGDNASGVNRIGLVLYDENGNKVREEEKPVDASNQATFTIEANFKGRVTAYAVDNVNNNNGGSLWFTPDNAVVETQSQHNNASGVTFIAPGTTYTDYKNQPLYPKQIQMTFAAKSTYAGIKTVTYQIKSPWHELTETINVSAAGVIDKAVDSFGKYIDNNGNETNLVTNLTKTIDIPFNDNDIELEVTVEDRAGLSSTYKYDKVFSIDTTPPEIKVEYDTNSPNVVDGKDYYKQDRVATITVTERNFNPNDFECNIQNIDLKVKPDLNASTNWTSYTVDPSNPDATVHVATITYHDDGDYVFDCSYTDLAGHEQSVKPPVDKFTIDQTVPVIRVSYDWTSANGYHNKTRVATITVTEHNFYAASDYVKVNITAGGPENPPTPSVSGWTTLGDTSTATITFSNDGRYSFTVDCRDKALNDAVRVEESTFYIDTKIDLIEIVDVENMVPYKDKIAPTIRYFDNNYETSSYTLTRVEFGKNAEEVKNIVPGDGSAAGLSRLVSYADFEHVVENDGIYVIGASITDKAGNTKKASDVLFSVNRFGSTFTILDKDTLDLVADKFYTNDAPDIKIREFNVNSMSETSIMVNRDNDSRQLVEGSNYTVEASGSEKAWHIYDYNLFKNNFEEEGNYVITVSSKDEFGAVVTNRTAYQETDSDGKNVVDRNYPVSFVVDKTEPIVTISGIEDNEYYEEAVRKVIVDCDDANITSKNLEVKFDDKVLEKDKDFLLEETAGSVELTLELEADGNQNDRTFTVTIADKAGNRNSDGKVSSFRLSASWLARLLHYHLPLVIIAGVVVLGGIAFVVFMAAKKRRNSQDKA